MFSLFTMNGYISPKLKNRVQNPVFVSHNIETCFISMESENEYIYEFLSRCYFAREIRINPEQGIISIPSFSSSSKNKFTPKESEEI